MNGRIGSRFVVADPGFPVRGANSLGGGEGVVAKLLGERFSAETHVKTKKLGPVGGDTPGSDIRHF